MGSLSVYLVAPWKIFFTAAQLQAMQEAEGSPHAPSHFFVNPVRVWRRCGLDDTVPFRKSRLVLVIIGNVLNWSLMIYGVVSFCF
jgi:hypothetical protein